MITAVREGVKLGVTIIAAATTVIAASKGSDLIGKAFRSTRAKFSGKEKTASKVEKKPITKKTTSSVEEKPTAKKATKKTTKSK